MHYPGLKVLNGGIIAVNRETGQTSLEAVYAGGDMQQEKPRYQRYGFRQNCCSKHPLPSKFTKKEMHFDESRFKPNLIFLFLLVSLRLNRLIRRLTALKARLTVISAMLNAQCEILFMSLRIEQMPQTRSALFCGPDKGFRRLFPFQLFHCLLCFIISTAA